MTLDEVIQELIARIRSISPNAEIKTVKISDEEARLSVSVGAAEVQPIRQATFQPVLELLSKEGLDIQVLVYDKDHPPEIG